MRYVLGIHLGATRVTAAVCRYRAGRWDGPEVVPLAGAVPWAESVLHVSGEGDLLVGQAALHRATVEPERVARAPLQRTGDPVPFVLGEVSYPAETLAAGMIGWVADRVAECESAQAERIVVTHPPGWSAYRRGLLHDALDQAELPGVIALPSPIAAAECHIARAESRTGPDGAGGPDRAAPGEPGTTGEHGEPGAAGEVELGKLLGVCVLGGTGVRAAVLRRVPMGFELLAHAEGGEQEGGCHLDDLLTEHVLARAEIDENDPQAMARLRTACTAAKERLSRVPEAVVTETVSVTRQEFAELARPALTAALSRVRRLLTGVPSEQLACVVLAGGTARIPLAGHLARTMLACPVAVDDDPGSALCRGAAIAARPRPAPAAPPPVERAATEGTAVARGPAGSDQPSSASLITGVGELPAVYGQGGDEDQEPPPQRPPVEITPLEPPRRRFSFARRGASTDDRDEER